MIKKMKTTFACMALTVTTLATAMSPMALHAEELQSGTTTYTKSSAMANFCYQGYNQGVNGPISIVKGKMTTKNIFGISSTKDVYIVGLSGTEYVENQSTFLWTDILAAFELDNAYLTNTRNAILSYVPSGSNIIFTGHSLGGMVAQQCAADSTLKEKYNILNTVTFGSPLIDGFSREGVVKRLGDTTDVVPYLSLSTVNGGILWQYLGLNKEDGGYTSSQLVAAHCDSYTRDDVWGSYDVTGTKNGSTTITFNNDETVFFYSPSDYN